MLSNCCFFTLQKIKKPNYTDFLIVLALLLLKDEGWLAAGSWKTIGAAGGSGVTPCNCCSAWSSGSSRLKKKQSDLINYKNQICNQVHCYKTWGLNGRVKIELNEFSLIYVASQADTRLTFHRRFRTEENGLDHQVRNVWEDCVRLCLLTRIGQWLTGQTSLLLSTTNTI